MRSVERVIISTIVYFVSLLRNFVNDPRKLEKNNVLYHYPINHDRLVIGKFNKTEMVGLVKKRIAENIAAIRSGSFEKLKETKTLLNVRGFPLPCINQKIRRQL